MNIALLLLDTIDLSTDIDKLPPCHIFQSAQVDYEKKLADLALQVDEYIYLEKNTIDLVCALKNVNDIVELAIHMSNPLVSADTVYFVNKKYKGSFFCSPYVFSILGNLYKINYRDYQHLDHSVFEEMYIKKMFFLLDRLGFNIHAT